VTTHDGFRYRYRILRRFYVATQERLSSVSVSGRFVFTMVDPSRELDQSIQKLKKLSHHLSSNSPKALAEVYLASIALLVNLKVDQATLQKTR
jgi:hypothetical protein